MRIPSCVMLAMLLACYHLPAQQVTSFTQQQAGRIDSLLAVLAANQVFNGSVVVAEQGRVVYKRSHGYANFENRILNADTTPFNIASVSKPFTSLAVLQLVQKGKIKLTDPVVKYLPDFPYPDITIRHLLNQTSGLPPLERFEDKNIQDHPDAVYSSAEVYSHFVAQKPELAFQPGNRWAYNNANYIILALLVEKLSGMPFPAYMKKYIFTPAGMKKTYVRTVGMPNTPRYIIPAMYMRDYKNVDALDHKTYYTYYQLGSTYGPGNVVSTLQDLVLFDHALHQGKLVSKILLDSACTPLTLNNGKTFFMGATTRSYGMGWNVYKSRKEPVYNYIFHDGHIVGLSSVLHRNIDKGQTIILYDNTDKNPLQLMVAVNNILNDLPADKFRLTRSLVRVYGEALVNKGIDAAAIVFNELKTDSAHYYMDEMEMNSLGYDLLFKAPVPNHLQLSLEVFKINTLLYPQSANAYDSYAEALMKDGQKEAAIAMYTKTLAMNPNNDAAKKALQQLQQRLNDTQ